MDFSGFIDVINKLGFAQFVALYCLIVINKTNNELKGLICKMTGILETMQNDQERYQNDKISNVSSSDN